MFQYDFIAEIAWNGYLNNYDQLIEDHIGVSW